MGRRKSRSARRAAVLYALRGGADRISPRSPPEHETAERGSPAVEMGGWGGGHGTARRQYGAGAGARGGRRQEMVWHNMPTGRATTGCASRARPPRSPSRRAAARGSPAARAGREGAELGRLGLPSARRCCSRSRPGPVSGQRRASHRTACSVQCSECSVQSAVHAKSEPCMPSRACSRAHHVACGGARPGRSPLPRPVPIEYVRAGHPCLCSAGVHSGLPMGPAAAAAAAAARALGL